MRASEVAGDPDRLFRQLAGKPSEYCVVTAIAGLVFLAVDAAVMRDRGMAHPPEAGRNRLGAHVAGPDLAGVEWRIRVGQAAHLAAATSSMTISPICWMAPRTSPV